MTVLHGVVAGAGLVAVLLGLIWRMFVRSDARDKRAHAAITENVEAVDDRAERRSEAHRAALEAIARDVSFLTGRQAERTGGGVASGRDARRVQDSACSPPEARGDGLTMSKTSGYDCRHYGSGSERRNFAEHAPWLPFCARTSMTTSRPSYVAIVMLVVSLAFSVTSALAQNPAPEDWPMRGRALDGWGYSPLDQIDRNNVTQLEMVWSRVPIPGFQQGAPRVYDGIMYQFTSMGVIQARDATTGGLLWESKRVDSRDPDVLADFNRDLTVYGTHIIDTSDTNENSDVFALDVATGQHVTWIDERDPEQDVVYIALKTVNATLDSCLTRFRVNSREVRTHSLLTEYCITTNDGAVQAISTETDTVVWKYDPEAAIGRLAATGGGLVFGGDHDGWFRAFDHETGEIIWKIYLESPITHSPITYAADGLQYVAIYTDSSELFVFSAPCPLSESHSMSGPLVLYRDSPRPYWFFPFILTGVEQINVVRPDSPITICEAVHRSTWSERSLWLHIAAGLEHGWVDVGPYDSLETFLKH